jgi:hypothetical protein
MTASSGLEPQDEHPVEELAALLNGELVLEELRRVVRHVRRCASCQAELVEVGAGFGALRHSERAGMVPEHDAPVLPPLRERPRAPLGRDVPAPAAAVVPGRRNRLLALAGCVALLLVGAGVLIARGGSGSPVLKARFAQVGVEPARGLVEMSGRGASRTMDVAVSVPAAPAGSYYEVWLLNRASGGMVAVGVLPQGGTARFALPIAVVAHYDAVDISLQPDNGSTLHSDDSVLRATYS